jgi:hypothetical protein
MVRTPTAATASVPPGTATVPVNQGSPLFESLVDYNHTHVSVFSTALKTCTLRTSAKSKRIVIRRCERETSSGPWAAQDQELTTSFYVIDARSWRDQQLFVVGLTETGESVVERWAIQHPSPNGSGGAYVPLNQRRQPSVRRTVLSPRILYKLVLQEPYALVPLLSESTLPQMSSIKSVRFAQHVAEGRKYILNTQDRWSSTISVVSEASPFCVFLNDPDGRW